MLQVGHLERFSATYQAMAGESSAHRCISRRPGIAPFKPRGTDVSVILDLMIHDLDLVLDGGKRDRRAGIRDDGCGSRVLLTGAGSVSIDTQPPWVGDLVNYESAPVDAGTMHHRKGVNSGVWFA